jgi:hypothetical protein
LQPLVSVRSLGRRPPARPGKRVGGAGLSSKSDNVTTNSTPHSNSRLLPIQEAVFREKAVWSNPTGPDEVEYIVILEPGDFGYHPYCRHWIIRAPDGDEFEVVRMDFADGKASAPNVIFEGKERRIVLRDGWWHVALQDEEQVPLGMSAAPRLIGQVRGRPGPAPKYSEEATYSKRRRAEAATWKTVHEEVLDGKAGRPADAKLKDFDYFKRTMLVYFDREIKGKMGVRLGA